MNKYLTVFSALLLVSGLDDEPCFNGREQRLGSRLR